MRAPDLRDLDRRLVPGAARALRRLLDRADAVRRRAARSAGRGGRAAGGAVVGAGTRLDARYASRGPLALVRDVPQVALLLVAAVFVSGALAARWLDQPEPPPAAERVGRSGLASFLGVPAGSDVDGHLRTAAEELQRLAEDVPDRSRLALVSLRRYLAVDELPVALGGTAAQRVYLRAPGVAGAEVVEVPLTGVDAPTVLPALCTATAARKRGEAEELRKVAATVEATTPEETLQRDDFVAEATRADREAEAFSGPCSAAYALVVEASVEDLAALLQRPDVRGVEVAPGGLSVLELEVAPLLPETTGVVPNGNER